MWIILAQITLIMILAAVTREWFASRFRELKTTQDEILRELRQNRR